MARDSSVDVNIWLHQDDFADVTVKHHGNHYRLEINVGNNELGFWTDRVEDIESLYEQIGQALVRYNRGLENESKERAGVPV